MATTATTVKITTSTSAEGVATGTGKPGTHAATGARTSAPALTHALATHQFKANVAKSASKKRRAAAVPKASAVEAITMIPTGQNRRTVPATTRTAALRLISKMSLPKGGLTKEAIQRDVTHFQPVTGALTTNITGEPGPFHLTKDLEKTLDDLGKSVLKDKSFTARKTLGANKLSKADWEKITSAAEQKADERVQAAAESREQAKAQALAKGTTTTGTVTGAKLYQSFIDTYNSDAKKKTPTTGKTVNSRTYWDSRFVAMGLTSTYTPSRSEAETAFKTLLKAAAAGTKTVTAIIQTHVKQHAATLAAAEAVVGKTGKVGQALSDYFVTEFTTLAHTYLVPISDATINQRAALAAQAGTGYEAKENEVSDFRATMEKQAASLYPTFATQINKGVTTQTLLNPYAEVAAKTLGYGTASATETAMEALGITWLDPKWNPALSGGKAATGKLAAPMSLTAWRQHLINTRQYGWTKTATAQQMKLNVGQSLAQAFGLRKS